jgi:hypothetical protein
MSSFGRGLRGRCGGLRLVGVEALETRWRKRIMVDRKQRDLPARGKFFQSDLIIS